MCTEKIDFKKFFSKNSEKFFFFLLFLKLFLLLFRNVSVYFLTTKTDQKYFCEAFKVIQEKNKKKIFSENFFQKKFW